MSCRSSIRYQSCLTVAVIALGCLSSSCEWREEKLDSNGQLGELALQATVDDDDLLRTGFCGRDPEQGCRESCAGRIATIPPKTYDLIVSRRIWVRSGNGLGDSGEHDEHVPLTGEASVRIEPAGVAVVQEVFLCDGVVRMMLQAKLAEDFTLEVDVDGYQDFWLVPTVDGCTEPYTCPD